MAAPRYVHTNLVARDWRALERFYMEVFGCERVPPERDYAGAALEAGTSIPGATLRGAHLRLPGHGPRGPTLEIFSYTPECPGLPYAVNRPGWGHIAFEVDRVDAVRAEVLARGGASVGDVVRLHTADGRGVTWCYVTDPEGNVIELQAWDPE
jgi:catechol 2,3-dioxygenase-like lactoylglutathione lyase family enzyme